MTEEQEIEMINQTAIALFARLYVRNAEIQSGEKLESNMAWLARSCWGAATVFVHVREAGIESGRKFLAK